MRLRGTSLLVKLSVLGCGLLASQASLSAQDGVRRYRENGVEYVEHSQTVLQPVSQNVVERHEETVYREEYVTQLRESQQTYFAPVTEYHWEPRIHGRFNPLRPQTVAYHLVPRTRWEPRAQTVRTPITYRQLRPETRIVEVPRRELGFAQRQEVTHTAIAPGDDGGARVAARHHALPSGAPQTAPSATITSAPPSAPHVIIPAPPATIGGVLQMDGDHPRYGAIPANRY